MSLACGRNAGVRTKQRGVLAGKAPGHECPREVVPMPLEQHAALAV